MPIKSALAEKIAADNFLRSMTRNTKAPPSKPAPARRSARPRPILPVDLLTHPQLDRQPAGQHWLAADPDVVTYVNPDRPRELQVVPTVNPLSKRRLAVTTPDRPRQRGPEALLALFRKWGMELRLVSGDLVAYGRDGAMPDGGRKLLEDATPLLRAHLGGDPLRCRFPHTGEVPVALTLAAPSGVPMCADHADGTDPDLRRVTATAPVGIR